MQRIVRDKKLAKSRSPDIKLSSSLNDKKDIVLEKQLFVKKDTPMEALPTKKSILFDILLTDFWHSSQIPIRVF